MLADDSIRVNFAPSIGNVFILELVDDGSMVAWFCLPSGNLTELF